MLRHIDCKLCLQESFPRLRSQMNTAHSLSTPSFLPSPQGTILQQFIPPSSSPLSLCGEWPSNARLINHSWRSPTAPSLPLPPSCYPPLPCCLTVPDRITTPADCNSLTHTHRDTQNRSLSVLCCFSRALLHWLRLLLKVHNKLDVGGSIA